MAGARILWVEDERPLLEANREYFNRRGYETLTAETLREAERILRTTPPDLVILDVMLPDGSGFDFCRKIRTFSNVPVIFLTALGNIKDEEQGFALGGDDYLIKPYDMNRLGIRVSAILRRMNDISSGRTEIPPLSLDPVMGVCILDGVSVTLSPMELRLLHFFMKNPNRQIHRDTIYKEVWGVENLENTQTVVEHVYRLRKKLGMSDPDSYFNISSENKEYRFSKVRY